MTDMDTNLVVEGLKFMGLGMGAVFLFLATMIIFMSFMSKIIHKFFPEVEPAVSSPASNAQNDQNQKKVVAAITAAIKFHRES